MLEPNEDVKGEIKTPATFSLCYSSAGRYYMTEDEIRKEEGETLLEWAENQREIKRRRSVALKMYQALFDATQAVQFPERIQFPEEEPDKRYAPAHILKSLDGLDVKAIRESRDAIRALLDQQEILKQRKAGFKLD